MNMAREKFQLKQTRYELMQLLEILFNKKDFKRISAKIPYDMLAAKTRELIKAVIDDKSQIMSSISAADTLDDYTMGHCLNVCMICILIGDIMDFNYQKLTDLAISALLHDIGKRDIPKELLHKSGNLTDEEFDLIKNHPRLGGELVSEIYPWLPDRIIHGIQEHHERMDGKGYPDHLSWYDISEFGRIIAVADVYEAFTALRSYHDKRTMNEGVHCIRSSKGLDRNIVEIFTENAVFYPEGLYVVLSDKSVAVVSKNHSGCSLPDVTIPGTHSVVDLNDKHIISVLSN